jgi:hypothetical protein
MNEQKKGREGEREREREREREERDAYLLSLLLINDQVLPQR